MAEEPLSEELKFLYIIAKTLKNIEGKMDSLNEKLQTIDENIDRVCDLIDGTGLTGVFDYLHEIEGHLAEIETSINDN